MRPRPKLTSVTSPKVKDGSLKAGDFAKGELPQGARGLQGLQGPPGTTHAYEASGFVNYDKLSTTVYGSTVIAMPVPPGNYFTTVDVYVETVNLEPTEVYCRLLDGGGSSAEWVVSRTQSVRADGSDEFTLSGLFPVSSGESLSLQCSKKDAAASARVTDANMVAVQVGDITRLFSE